MFSINNLAMGFGGRTLFRDASIVFNRGARYGIVGANGSGKSTLVRVIAGDEEPTDGSLSIPKSVRVGVLRQDHFQYENTPILDVVMQGVPDLWAAMEEKAALLAESERTGEFDMDRYGELEDIITALDGYSLEARAGEVLEGLSIPTEVHQEPLSILSGGFKLRVLLAQVLAGTPDLLLLDEPTNHLDIVSIAWLERFLVSQDACVLVVSHDHRFLDAISTHIVDVDYERVMVYKGDYSHFETAKHEERGRKEAEIAKRQAEIDDHAAFIRRFKAKATKARQAQSRMKRMAKIEIEELPESSRRYPKFKLGARRQTGRVVIETHDISKAFDGKSVLEGVDLTIQRAERVAIIGANGIGKSTLLKIMMGLLEPDRGEIQWGHEATPGYFSQDLSEVRSAATSTLLDWLWNYCSDKPMGFVRGKLAEMLFSRDEVDKNISALSGGEVARLAFARLGVLEPTVLVLDEPTNHLDLEGIDALATGLENYPNAIIFVSHDRWFVSRLATRVIEISERGIEDFRGSYEDFVRWSESRDHLDAAAVLAKERERNQERKRKKKSKKNNTDAPAPPGPEGQKVNEEPGAKKKRKRKRGKKVKEEPPEPAPADSEGVRIRRADESADRKKKKKKRRK